MSETKKRFKTTIQGKTYVIVGTKSQPHMQAASEIVETQLNQLKRLTTGLDGERRAILMALNAVSDQLDLQQQLQQVKDEKRQLERELSKLEKSGPDRSVSEEV